ncbi:25158_t:CDS:1, partial [Dentiscutata erythropus]
VYTIRTIHDINPIPFICPSNYPYAFWIIETACKIRAANSICMWMYLTLMLIIICIGDRFFNNNNSTKKDIGYPEFMSSSSIIENNV